MNPLEARRRLLGRNVYKRTTEGNPAIAQGSLARMYPGIEMEGWTEQAQYEGKNLFDPSSNYSGYYTSSNNTLSLNNSATAIGYSWDIDIEGMSGEFTLSIFANVLSRFRFYIINTSNTVLYENVDSSENSQDYSHTFKIPEEAKKLCLSVLEIDSADDATIMLNSGSTALPYEPYTGGQPSPSPDYPQPITNAGKCNEETGKYQYEVKLTGENLFDINGDINTNWMGDSGQDNIVENGTLISNVNSSMTYPSGQVIDVVPNKEMSVIFDVLDLGNATTAYVEVYEAGVNRLLKGYYAGIEKNYRIVFISPNSGKILVTFASGHGTGVKYGNIRVLYTYNFQDYEPYRTPQTVTLTSDRPLTKWDKLEKRNGQWGWAYKSAEVVLDGTENYVTGAESYVSDFSSNCYTVISNMVRDGRTNAFMNRLSNIEYSWTQLDAIGFSKNLNQLHVRISNSDLGTTGESSASEITNAMKAYMVQQYEDGNPFIALYETTEETFVPLSESEQEAMNALYTFRPTTVLSNDCDCNMSLTYKTKKSLEVTT